MKPKKGLKDFTRKKQMYGRMFILPWMIGFVLFFAYPLLQSLILVFSTDQNKTLTDGVFYTTWNGFGNIYQWLYKETGYVENLVATIGSFIYTIPLIVALSLIVGVILNQKFKGRVMFRSIFFLPVIIATGVVMSYLAGDATAETMRGGSTSNGIDLSGILMTINLPENITTTLLSFINRIFDLFWDCGVQIVLFISGLQSIPEQLYEVCRVEGANKWEEFWYVTFPMLSGTTLLVIVFTAIEMFVDESNATMSTGFAALSQNMWVDGSTQLWIYFAVVGTLLSLVVLLLQKFLFSKWATE